MKKKCMMWFDEYIRFILTNWNYPVKQDWISKYLLFTTYLMHSKITFRSCLISGASNTKWNRKKNLKWSILCFNGQSPGLLNLLNSEEEEKEWKWIDL